MNWYPIEDLKNHDVPAWSNGWRQIILIDQTLALHTASLSVTGWRFKDPCWCGECDTLLGDTPSWGGWKITHFCIPELPKID